MDQKCKCSRCHILDQIDMTHPLCKDCLESWQERPKQPMRLEFPELSTQFSTAPVPSDVQAQNQIHLQFALYCQGLSFTNNLHFSRQADSVYFSRFVKQLPLQSAEKIKGFQAYKAIQDTGNFGFLDVVYCQTLGFYVITKGQITKGQFLCHYAGDVLSDSKNKLKDLAGDSVMQVTPGLSIFPNSRANIAKYILGVCPEDVNKANIECCYERYSDFEAYCVFFAKEHLPKGSLLYYDYGPKYEPARGFYDVEHLERIAKQAKQ